MPAIIDLSVDDDDDDDDDKKRPAAAPVATTSRVAGGGGSTMRQPSAKTSNYNATDIINIDEHDDDDDDGTTPTVPSVSSQLADMRHAAAHRYRQQQQQKGQTGRAMKSSNAAGSSNSSQNKKKRASSIATTNKRSTSSGSSNNKKSKNTKNSNAKNANNISKNNLVQVTLANSWNASTSKQDPMGYYLSEKLDGVRCLYQHGKLWTARHGNEIDAPEWFINALPAANICLDGMLHSQDAAMVMSVVQSNNPDDDERWSQISYQVFDAPLVKATFPVRLQALRHALAAVPRNIAKPLEQSICTGGRDHVLEYWHGITSMSNGEGGGVMLKKAKPEYTHGRSSNLLQVQTFCEAEAIVVGHKLGKGKHEGRLGALKCKMKKKKNETDNDDSDDDDDEDGDNGGRQALFFKIGTCFSNAERESPPAIGSTITYKYQELTDKGIPRFPTYLRTTSSG